ncbi:MAG: 16S rRNA (uracil(1498)-N(3))-methyltransferase, partial [uncultured Nocardioidaceae bacterium]
DGRLLPAARRGAPVRGGHRRARGPRGPPRRRGAADGGRRADRADRRGGHRDPWPGQRRRQGVPDGRGARGRHACGGVPAGGRRASRPQGRPWRARRRDAHRGRCRRHRAVGGREVHRAVAWRPGRQGAGQVAHRGPRGRQAVTTCVVPGGPPRRRDRGGRCSAVLRLGARGPARGRLRSAGRCPGARPWRDRDRRRPGGRAHRRRARSLRRRRCRAAPARFVGAAVVHRRGRGGRGPPGPHPPLAL